MKRKTKSVSSKHCKEEEIDRISNLSDHIIHHILSFIDMRFAVQTMVLSKRWLNVWKSLSSITANWISFATEEDIKSENYNPVAGDDFAYFLDGVFEFREVSDIQKINLVFVIWDALSVETLTTWIREATNRNVQDLDLITPYYRHSQYESAYHYSEYNEIPFEIPYELLNFESLRRLSISVADIPCYWYTRSILPQSMSLPQLRKLTLKGISIPNSELQRLLSSCPLMETVIIQDWDIQRNENRKRNKQRSIIISSQCLQFFELIDGYHERLGSAVNCLNCTTKISAPNLKYFKCTGFIREDFSLENLSSLVGAHLEMRLRDKREAVETAETYSELLADEKELFSKRMMRYLGAVHNVHHLTLSSGFLEVLVQAPGASNCHSPQLCNLETLKLEMRFTRGSVRSIAYLLKISPIIMNLMLISKESNLADVGDDWEEEFSSTGMFSHLKFVEIREVEGSDNELKFLIFLLKKSTVLEKVILFFRCTSDSLHRGRQVRQFKRSVSKLPTASSRIQMHFV